MGFEVLTDDLLNSEVFRDVTPCRLINNYRRFETNRTNFEMSVNYIAMGAVQLPSVLDSSVTQLLTKLSDFFEGMQIFIIFFYKTPHFKSSSHPHTSMC